MWLWPPSQVQHTADRLDEMTDAKDGCVNQMQQTADRLEEMTEPDLVHCHGTSHPKLLQMQGLASEELPFLLQSAGHCSLACHRR